MRIDPYSIAKKGFLSLSVLALSAGITSAQYCTPTFSVGCSTGASLSSCSSSGGITNFTNNNSNCGNSSTSYSDYTGTYGVKQEAFKSVDIKATYPSGAPGGSSAIVKIWVDWNKNGVFDHPAEYIAPNVTTDHVFTGPGQTKTVKITVPGTAKQGTTRMRVRVGSLGSIYDPNLTPCSNSAYGETEDYDFEIVNPCLPPEVVSFADLDYNSVNISWSSKLNAEMYEYYIKKDNTFPAPGTHGYKYTTSEYLGLEKLECDTWYYMFLRCVCDTPGSSQFWDESDWRLDSFKTEPCCYSPVLTVSNVTSTTAKVTWDPIATAYGYEYAVSTTPDPPVKGTYTTYTTLFLQGLPSKTTHFIHVRSRCTPTPLSDWSKAPFKTLKYLSIDPTNGVDFNMDAYPNPVKDKLYIRLNGKMGANAHVTVVGLTGNVIFSAPMTSETLTIDASSIPSGVYVVKYQDDIHQEIMKVTK